MDRKSRKKNSGNEYNMAWGKRRLYDRSTGESYISWGPDNSERAINLRKKMFR